MSRLHKYIINIHVLSCLIFTITVLFCLNSRQTWGHDADSGSKIVTSPPPLEQTELITSGVYGPFSSYYRPSLLFGNEMCRLVKIDYKSFQVICFPVKTSSGMRLAETDEVKNIQAQLVAVNGPNGKPMPELIVFFPLGNMEQQFFSQNITNRLLRESSIFDSPCKLTYQIDEQPPINEDWSCSSFLNYFDKYTGQKKLYYELRARPTALRPTFEKANTAMAGNLDWFDFFKKLHNNKEFKIRLALDEELTIESTLDFADYGKWIDGLLAVHKSDESDQLYENINVPEKIYGPFSNSACEVDRYVKTDGNEHHKRLYEDIFLINCDRYKIRPDKKTSADRDIPKWLYRIFDYQTFEGSSAASSAPDNDDIFISLRFQGFAAPSGILMSSVSNSLFISTSLHFPLTQMKPDFFYSKLVRETLNDLGQLKVPCNVSFIVDGEPASNESFKCDLSYKISWAGVVIVLDLDYGLVRCLQFGDKACSKAAFTKAVSFLKNIKKETEEIVMKIRFEGGETITANFNLDDFDFNDISLFLERIESLK